MKKKFVSRREGHENGDSVKSKKSRGLRKMMSMMKEEADFKDLPLVA